MDWQPISTAPRDEDIEVRVIQAEPHVLVGACRLTMAGWMNAKPGACWTFIRPTGAKRGPA